jgi:hypothetical protein
LTIVGEPNVLGPIGLDPEAAAHGDGIPGATRHIRTGLWSHNPDRAQLDLREDNRRVGISALSTGA